MIYKIAAVTQDGQKISNHFGMAPLYRVFTVVDGQIQGEEERPKPYHAQHPHHESRHSIHGNIHEDMFAPIGDCQVLLCAGMGQPAYQKALSAGLQVVLTDGDILASVQAFLQGKVSSDMRRVH